MLMDRYEIPLYALTVAAGVIVVVYAGYDNSLAGRLLGLALAGAGVFKIVKILRRPPAK